MYYHGTRRISWYKYEKIMWITAHKEGILRSHCHKVQRVFTNVKRENTSYTHTNNLFTFFFPRCYFYCLTESCPKLLPALDSLPVPSLGFLASSFAELLCSLVRRATKTLPLCDRVCFSLRACPCARWPSSTTSLVLPTSKVCPSSGSSFIFYFFGGGLNPYPPLSISLSFACCLWITSCTNSAISVV